MLSTLLRLTTTTLKFALAAMAFLVWTPAAYAWSWPVQGPVVKPFSYDAADPYASGQHRGVDIGADAVGEAVVAPAAGTISFAGTVPTNGRSVTIQTADGYSVTLTHLGSIAVAKGAVVAEQDAIGTIGPSGTAEEAGPYVHLGIRLTADPNGYLDPLGFLPSTPTGGGADGSTPARPASSGSSTATPAHTSRASTPHKQGATSAKARSRASRQEGNRAGESGAAVTARPSAQRPAVRSGKPESGSSRPARTHQRSATEPERSVRRPGVETAAPVERAPLDAGHESRPASPVAESARARRRVSGGGIPLVLNGAAALVAVVAALIAARSGRRRQHRMESAQVLHLRGLPAGHRPASRAA